MSDPDPLPRSGQPATASRKSSTAEDIPRPPSGNTRRHTVSIEMTPEEQARLDGGQLQQEEAVDRITRHRTPEEERERKLLLGREPDEAASEVLSGRTSGSETGGDNNVKDKLTKRNKKKKNRPKPGSKTRLLSNPVTEKIENDKHAISNITKDKEVEVQHSSDLSSENEYFEVKAFHNMERYPYMIRRELARALLAQEIDQHDDLRANVPIQQEPPSSRQLCRTLEELAEKLREQRKAHKFDGGDPDKLPWDYQRKAMVSLNKERLRNYEANQTNHRNQPVYFYEPQNNSETDSIAVEVSHHLQESHPSNPPSVAGDAITPAVPQPGRARTDNRYIARSKENAGKKENPNYERNCQPTGPNKNQFVPSIIQDKTRRPQGVSENINRRHRARANSHASAPHLPQRGLGPQPVNYGRQPIDYREHIQPPADPEDYQDSVMTKMAKDWTRGTDLEYGGRYPYVPASGLDKVPDDFCPNKSQPKYDMVTEIRKIMHEQGRPKQNNIAPAPKFFSPVDTVDSTSDARAAHIQRMLPNPKYNTFTGGQRRDDVGIVTLLTRLTRAQNQLNLSKEEFFHVMLDYFQGHSRRKLEALINEPDITAARVYQRLLEIYHSKDSTKDAREKLAHPKDHIYAKNLADAGAEIGTLASTAVRDMVPGPRKKHTYHTKAIEAFMELIPTSIQHNIERDIEEHKEIYGDEPTFEHVLNIAGKYQNTLDYHILKILSKNEKKTSSAFSTAKLTRNGDASHHQEAITHEVPLYPDDDSADHASSASDSEDDMSQLVKATLETLKDRKALKTKKSLQEQIQKAQNSGSNALASGLLPPTDPTVLQMEQRNVVLQQAMPDEVHYHDTFAKRAFHENSSHQNYRGNHSYPQTRPFQLRKEYMAPNTIRPGDTRNDPIPKGPDGRHDLNSGPCWSCGSSKHPSFNCPIYPYSGLTQNPCRNCDLNCFHPEHLCHVMLMQQMHATADKNHQQMVAKGKEHLPHAPSAASVAEAAMRVPQSAAAPPPKNGQ